MKIICLFFLCIVFTVENLQAQSTGSELVIATKYAESIAVIESKFDGDWLFEKTVKGRYVSLSVKLKQSGDQLTGEYSNASSKESSGKILRSKVTGNTAIIEINCDWGGRGRVKITRLKGNRLHWQVIKRDERKGQFIVLQDEILTKQERSS